MALLVNLGRVVFAPLIEPLAADFAVSPAGLAAVAAPLAVGAVLVLGDWRLAFLGLAVLGALVSLYTVFAARGAELPEAGTADRHLLPAVRAQWPIVLTGIVVVGAVGFVWNRLFNFYVSYLVAGKDLTPGTARTLLTVVFAAGLPAFLLTGRLADRVSNVPLLLAVIGGFAATVYALTVATGLVAIAAVSVLLGYVVHSLFPVVDTYLLASLPDRHRASAYTAYSASMMVVQAQGSLAVGGLVGSGLAYDTVFAWFAGGLLVVLAGLVGLHVTGHIPAGRVPGTPAAEG